MKIIRMPDVLHEYLLHLIEAHAARGIHPEEGMAIAQLWQYAQDATTIPDDEIRRMVAAGAPPAPGDPPAIPHVHLPTDPHVPGQSCACDRDPRTPVPRTEPKDDPDGGAARDSDLPLKKGDAEAQ